MYYIDDDTHTIKNGTHALFDEAYFTVESKPAPLAAQALQRLGYANFDNEFRDGVFIPDATLKIKQLSPKAKTPTQSTSESIGLDLYHSREDIIIKPGQMTTLHTDISIEPPKGTYVRIAPRSGLAHKHQLHVLAGVIDADYRGPINVLLHNLGTTNVTITQGQRIAQMICEKAVIPKIEVNTTLSDTIRGNNGFGSTESNDKTPHIIRFNIDEDPRSESTNSPIDIPDADLPNIVRTMSTQIEPPYHISLGTDPFDDYVDIDIGTKGNHTTLGLEFEDKLELGNRMQLMNCATSTPAARIPRWRSTLRYSFPISVGNKPVRTLTDIKIAVKQARNNHAEFVTCRFGLMEKTAMHPQNGVPIIFHDQLNIISEHLQSIKLSMEERNKKHQKYLTAIIPQVSTLKSSKKRAKLTRKILKQQEDWSEWLQSEHKQLTQYENQGMFSDPTPIPPDANSLPFIWTYLIKECGTKKARGVCNGSPRMKGTVTLGETYAASLDQTCAKIFWALNAAKGHIVVGADASNAFAEAPAPCAPLYMKLDSQFHTWWKSLGRAPIPDGYGVKVHKALQGHPESPRLWAKLIDKVITDLGFQTCRHEPCLYYHPDYKGQEIYFIRQVDDFAIGCQ